jgi:hypothetical protein
MTHHNNYHARNNTPDDGGIGFFRAIFAIALIVMVGVHVYQIFKVSRAVNRHIAFDYVVPVDKVEDAEAYVKHHMPTNIGYNERDVHKALLWERAKREYGILQAGYAWVDSDGYHFTQYEDLVYADKQKFRSDISSWKATNDKPPKKTWHSSSTNYRSTPVTTQPRRKKSNHTVELPKYDARGVYVPRRERQKRWNSVTGSYRPE